MNSEYILEMKNISKIYPGVRALDEVTLRVKKGHVHALVGENGAGKSTLMKTLNGVVGDYEGSILINGREVNMDHPNAAHEAGVSIIFQEFNLINSLSVAENVFLGRLFRKKNGTIDWCEVMHQTDLLLNKIGLNIHPKTLIEKLSVAEKQMVEIAKALSYNAEIIVMDEPSATLTNKELENLFKIIRDLKKNNVTIIYISHRMEEIFEICDDVTVLRDGKLIDSEKIGVWSREEIIEKMVGRSLEMEFPPRYIYEANNEKPSENILEVEDLSRDGVLNNISFKLKKGEILGIAGLVGAGRTELLRAIFGADSISKGTIRIKNKEVTIKNPTQAKSQGLAFLTEDRKSQGLILKFDIRTNTTLTHLKGICKGGLLSTKKESDIAKKYVEMLGIKSSSILQKAMDLSGGNQQKVVLAKWLYTDSDIIFLDEPTRGIDVGAKYEIYCIMNDLIKMGKSIIMISSELPEVIAMSDRILVMHEGNLKGEFSRSEASPESIMKCALTS